MANLKTVLGRFPPEASIAEAHQACEDADKRLADRVKAVRAACKHETALFCEKQPMSYSPHLPPIWRCTLCGLERQSESAWTESAPAPFNDFTRSIKIPRDDIYRHRDLFGDENFLNP